jgi:hypothetical protein
MHGRIPQIKPGCKSAWAHARPILVEVTGTPGHCGLLDAILQELRMAFKISLMPTVEDANGFGLRPA